MDGYNYDWTRPFLTNGDYMLWQGRPEGAKLLTKGDVFVIPFSLLWCGFAIFWTVSATLMGGAFGLFGLPFVAVGLYLVFGRFIHRRFLLKRTEYLITNSAVVFNINGRITSLRRDNLPPMTLNMSKDGYHGSITFSYGVTPAANGRYVNASSANAPDLELTEIADVEKVWGILNR